MELNLKKLVAICLFITLGHLAHAQIPKDVMLSLKSGDDKVLAKYFNTTIELAVDNKEGVYSKAQAQQIVRTFFAKTTPTKFTILHQGGDNDKARYAVGNLTTKASRYRVYLLIQTKKGKQLIYQLRFEKE